MVPEQRRREILSALAQSGYLSVSELAGRLYVSAPTIRRDLAELEKEGSVTRTHGGASYVDADFTALPFSLRNKQDLPEKRTIARLAANFVLEGQSVGIDQGSTTWCLAQEVQRRGAVGNIRVLTNGIPIAQTVSRINGARVELPCGTFDPQHEAVVGSEAADYVMTRHLDVTFLSLGGISARYGLTGRTKEDISVKRAFVRRSDVVVALLDHNKFDVALYYDAISLEDVDILVADVPLPEELQQLCEDCEVNVLTHHEGAQGG